MGAGEGECAAGVRKPGSSSASSVRHSRCSRGLEVMVPCRVAAQAAAVVVKFSVYFSGKTVNGARGALAGKHSCHSGRSEQCSPFKSSAASAAADAGLKCALSSAHA